MFEGNLRGSGDSRVIRFTPNTRIVLHVQKGGRWEFFTAQNAEEEYGLIVHIGRSHIPRRVNLNTTSVRRVWHQANNITNISNLGRLGTRNTWVFLVGQELAKIHDRRNDGRLLQALTFWLPTTLKRYWVKFFLYMRA